MVEASNIKKMTKKVFNYMDEVISSKDLEERGQAVSELLEFLDSNEESLGEIPETEISEMLSPLFENLEGIDEDKVMRLLTLFKKIAPKNLVLKVIEIELSFKNNEFERTIELMSGERALCDVQRCNDMMRESSVKISNYIPAVLYYSGCGVYDEAIFNAYLESQLNEETSTRIIFNLKDADERDNLIAFLKDLIKFDSNTVYLVELADAYRHSDNKSELEKVLEMTNEESITNIDHLVRVALNFEFVGDLRRALSVARRGLEMDSNNKSLLKMRSRALMKLESPEIAIEAYEDLLARYPDDIESVREIIDLYYSIEDYENTLRYLVVLNEIDKYDISDFLKRIDCETKLSKFDDAVRDVNSALSEFGEDIEVLKCKFNLEKTVHDPSYAYHTAERIMQLYPSDRDILHFVLDYLFDNNEYELFLEKMDYVTEGDIKEEYIDKRISSLLNTEEFDKAMELIRKDRKLFCADSVLDALFFNVREDWQIQEIVEIINGEESSEFRVPLVVLYKLQGKKFNVTNEIKTFLENSKSIAIASIVALDNIDFEKREIPDYVNDFISKPRFHHVREIVDIIMSIYSNKFREEWRDSPKFLYPLVNAFATIGDYESARNELEKACENRRADPFYYYYDALIYFRTDKNGMSSKSLDKATSMLTNVQFLNLSLEIDLKEGELKDAIKSIETIIELKEPKSVNFAAVYRYIVERKNWEFSNNFLDLMEYNQISNIWTNRIKRDLFLSQGDDAKAEEFSRIISEDTERNIDDVKSHSEILETNGKTKERVRFLEEISKVIEDPQIDIWIGDYHYSGKKFDLALNYYREAIEKGVEPLSIVNYPDTLIETGTYEEAGNVIKRMKDPGALRIKLYYKIGNIQKIVELLKNVVVSKKEDEEQISYISRILWRNREVRDTLLKMYEDEGYLFLGKLIAERMTESNEYKKAIEIMRNVQKNYPNDMDNVKSLTEALSKTGQTDEAISVLVKSLKVCKDVDEKISIIEPLMRFYYEDHDYDSIIDFYEADRDCVNSTVIQYVIRSYISTENFDSADKLIGKSEGSLLNRDLVEELNDELKVKKEFVETLEYAYRLFKLEYKAGKTFDFNEAVYKAEIPLEKVEEVYDFLKSEDYYLDINEEKYEILSRDVIQSIVKHTTAENIHDIRINTIFNNLDRKDAVVAKNLYLYIKKSIEKVREPRIHDEDLTALLRMALKDGIKPEPLNLAFYLKVGISTAMDVLTLMNYMSRLNEQGGL